MSRIDEILAKQKELEEDLKLAKEEERDVVLKDIKKKITMFDFKIEPRPRTQSRARETTAPAPRDYRQDARLSCRAVLE